MSDPISTPKAYDRIALDGAEVPLLCRLMSGGEREVEFANQQGPGYEGAYTVFKNGKLSTVGYEFVMMSVDDFATVRALVQKLRAGMKNRLSPRVYRLTDPNLEGSEITQIACYKIGPQKQTSPGKARWTRAVEFTEYKKRAPIGGAIKPTSNDVALFAANQAVLAAKAQRDALAAPRAARLAAAKAGK